MKSMHHVFIAVLLTSTGLLGGLTPSSSAAESTAPTEKEVASTLRAAYDRPATGINPAKSVEIKSMKISKESRPWSAPGDVGGPGSTIWLVKINYLMRTHYNTRTVVTEYDYYYDLTKNKLDEWVIQNSSQAGSKTTRLKDEPASVPDFKKSDSKDDPARKTTKDTPAPKAEPPDAGETKFVAPKLPNGYGTPRWDFTALEDRFTFVKSAVDDRDRLYFVLKLKKQEKTSINTLGCRLNHYDADGKLIQAIGTVSFDPPEGEKGDVVRLTLHYAVTNSNKEYWAKTAKLKFVVR